MIVCCMFAIGLITMTGCKKKDTIAADSDTSGANDVSVAENTSNDVVNIGAQASEKGSTLSYREANDQGLFSCASVVIDSVVNRTITVTFNGSTCLDGRTRSGSLVFNYSASPASAKHYRDPGFTFTVTSQNYIVDGNQVNIINKTVTNTTPAGFNPSTTNETWSISANISIIRASNAGTVTWTCNRTITLLNTASVYPMTDTIPGHNYSAIDWPMAKTQLDGTASGTRANGETYTATATAMVRDFGGCNIAGRHPFISGELDYSPSGKATRYINFGNGTCDLLATVTIYNVSYTITLP